METKAPVFVRIHEYEDAINTLDTVKKKLHEAKEILAKLQDLKAQEDHEIATWSQSLDDAATKIAVLEKNLIQ